MSPEEFDEVSRMVGPAEIDTVVRARSQPGAPGVSHDLLLPFLAPLSETYLRYLSKPLTTCLFTGIGVTGDLEIDWDCQQLFFKRVCWERGEEQESKASSVCLAGGGEMAGEEGVSL